MNRLRAIFELRATEFAILLFPASVPATSSFNDVHPQRNFVSVQNQAMLTFFTEKFATSYFGPVHLAKKMKNTPCFDLKRGEPSNTASIQTLEESIAPR